MMMIKKKVEFKLKLEQVGYFKSKVRRRKRKKRVWKCLSRRKEQDLMGKNCSILKLKKRRRKAGRK